MNQVMVHVGLTVLDMARAERFYTQALGFSRDRELRLTADRTQQLMQIDPPSDLHAVYLTLGAHTVELMAWTPRATATAGQRAFNHSGLTHLAIAVEDVAASCEQVTQLGGQVLSHQGRAAVIRDPDGQIIELLHMEVYREVQQARKDRPAEE